MPFIDDVAARLTDFARSASNAWQALWDHVTAFPPPRLNVISWGSNVWTWLRALPRLAFDFIAAPLRDGLRLIRSALRYTTKWAFRAYNFAERISTRAIPDVFRRARDWAWERIKQARRFAAWLTDRALRVIAKVRGALESFSRWAKARIADSWNWIQRAPGWVASTIDRWWDATFGRLVTWIDRHVVAPILRRVNERFGPMLTWFREVGSFTLRAARGFARLLTDPVRFFRGLVDFIMRRVVPAAVAQVLRTMLSQLSRIEDILVRLF